MITLRADGELGTESVTCSVDTGRVLVEAGLHSATGGDGVAVCSGDMLLHALVACTGVTLRAVATALEVQSRAGPCTPKVTWTSAALSGSPRTHRSASGRSGCVSPSTPQPVRSSWPPCCGSPSGTASSTQTLASPVESATHRHSEPNGGRSGGAPQGAERGHAVGDFADDGVQCGLRRGIRCGVDDEPLIRVLQRGQHFESTASGPTLGCNSGFAPAHSP
jgi:hypothetical protein